MSKATPYPAPLEYDADSGELSAQGAHVASVASVEDFPCLDPEEDDLDAIQAQIDATGRKLARAYNAHDDLLAACKAFAEAMRKGDRPGMLSLINALHLADAAIKKTEA